MPAFDIGSLQTYETRNVFSLEGELSLHVFCMELHWFFHLDGTLPADWVDPKAGLYTVVERQFSRNSNLGRPTRSHSRYLLNIVNEPSRFHGLSHP
jgi:hypothetical protein